MNLDDRISILLADDRPENLLSLETLLDDPGYRLIRAQSGPEALKAMLRHDIALILLDVQMPGMEGFETARLIKGRNRSKDIPIILVTAIGKENRYVFEGNETGAVDYLLMHS